MLLVIYRRILTTAHDQTVSVPDIQSITDLVFVGIVVGGCGLQNRCARPMIPDHDQPEIVVGAKHTVADCDVVRMVQADSGLPIFCRDGLQRHIAHGMRCQSVLCVIFEMTGIQQCLDACQNGPVLLVGESSRHVDLTHIKHLQTSCCVVTDVRSLHVDCVESAGQNAAVTTGTNTCFVSHGKMPEIRIRAVNFQAFVAIVAEVRLFDAEFVFHSDSMNSVPCVVRHMQAVQQNIRTPVSEKQTVVGLSNLQIADLQPGSGISCRMIHHNHAVVATVRTIWRHDQDVVESIHGICLTVSVGRHQRQTALNN